MENKIIEYFKNKNIKIIYLFGSAAREELREDSDIDIAVIGEMDFYKKLEYVTDLAEVLGIEIDLIDFEKADTNFQAEILVSGKCIYCIDKEEKENLEMKVFSKYLTLEEDRAIVIKSIYERGSVF